MIYEKTLFFEKINSIISKKWNRKTSSVFNLSSQNEPVHATNYRQSISSLQTDIVERLEERIKKLEVQNIQLADFIDFLIEHLPDLIQNFLQHEDNKALDNFSFSDATNDSPADKKLKYDCCPTRREMEVLEYLIKGLCAKEIASKLLISETTVITHKKNLKEKFKAKNTAEMISKAQGYLPKNSLSGV
ncbi:MAG TPA: helix-turn-helix transcriptional regulator [Puia sp.]|nr:helix-turn-helix transcriptional regulator [Puia sp.]